MKNCHHRALLQTGLILCGLPIACSESPNEPAGDATIQFVEGVAQSDTIGAVLPAHIVVEVRDARQRPAVGVTVRFQNLSEDFPGSANPLTVLEPALDGPVPALDVVTDADGRAAVRVRLGDKTDDPAARVLKATVTRFGVQVADTLDVLPGQPLTLEVSIPEVAQVGDDIQPDVRARDRASNEIPNVSFTLHAVTPTVVVAPDGQTLQAAASGLATARARAGATARTFGLLIVPAGPLAGMREELFGRSLVLTKANGEIIRNLGAGWNPAWNPGGDSLVYHLNGELMITDTLGRSLAVAPDLDVRATPVWASTGEIFFARSINPHIIWRILPDGSELGPAVVDSGASFTAGSFDVSPDGNRFAYSRGGQIVIFDRNTHTKTTLTAGVNPLWSPSGEWLLYTIGGSYVRSVSVNGQPSQLNIEPTNIVDPHPVYQWTSDGNFVLVGHRAGTRGRWIIVHHETRTRHDLFTDYYMAGFAGRHP